MPVVASSLHAASFIKMEDRKRPATDSVADLAPPSKRAAINGGTKARDDGDNKDEAWIEDFTKDAIYRQMLEYKRQTAVTETRLAEVEARAGRADDHFRVVDNWWLQLLQEVELLAKGTVVSTPESSAFPATSGLTFEQQAELRRHLDDKSRAIKSSLEPLFSRLANSRGQIQPDSVELEAQIKKLLAAQKDYAVKLDRAITERESLSEQLDAATLRYMKSERKLDRAKSTQVQRLEQAALANDTKKPGNDVADAKKDTTESNGDKSELVAQYEEALAVTTKLKQQLDSTFVELKTLQDAHSALKLQGESVTEESYARTEVFKQFRGQNDDLIKRINHLEATNRALREEAEKMRGDRTSFRSQLEREAQNVTGELEDQLQQKEQDLTRIRSARDELLADQGIRKAYQDQDRAALEHTKELLSAREERTNALEMQLERLKGSTDGAITSSEVDSMSPDELKQKLQKLEKDYESINKELPSMEKAYKKAMGLASKKVMDFAALEERVTLLTLEKAKADQKYFAARRDADIRINEIKSLRQQNGKSSEIIAQLKEAESQARTLVGNLEKQLLELKQTNGSVMEDNRTLKTAAAEASRRADTAKTQIVELGNNVRSHDSATIAMKQKVSGQEVENERLRVRLENMQKDRDSWKTKSLNNSSEDEEMLRGFALCSVCRSNFKGAILKTCGHMFCMKCLTDRVSTRMRKCPTCSKPFDKSDCLTAHF